MRTQKNLYTCACQKVGTGSDVIKNRKWLEMARSRVLWWETADQLCKKKSIAGSDGGRGAFGIRVRSYNPRWRRLDKKTPIFLKRKCLLMVLFPYLQEEEEGTWTQVVNDTCPRKRVQSPNWIRWLATTMSGTMIPWRQAAGREDEGRMTNYASQAAARSPKFNVMGRNTRPGKEYKSIRKVIICEQIILT